ncbi:MAG: hypothetical protein R2817_05565 [Flavobacteriales bacterium]
MRALILLTLALLAAVGLNAQDNILLMNGRVITAKVLGQSTLEIRYLVPNGKAPPRERQEPTEDVFSVTDSLGRERIWYFYDTVFGNDMSVDQMRSYIKGQQDARDGYKPTWTTVGGFVFGAGTVIAANLEMNAFFLPPIYAVAMTLPRVNVTRGSIRDPYMEGNEDYAYGYARVGRTKRVVRGLLSTFAGIGTGLLVRQLVINPNLEGY